MTRETYHNIWIRNGSLETKISKKTYKTGGIWDSTHYYEETEEIKEKFIKSYLRRQFRKKIEEMKSCENEKFMKYMIALKIPDVTKN